MKIAAVRDVVLFCQLLFGVAQPCCTYYNSYYFQVISYMPEGKYVFLDGRLP